MKPEIKQRIEQIKAGQVPDGYKKTKIGIVPVEWNDICFSDLFVSKSEYTEDLEKYPLYSLTIEDGVTAKSERYERSHLVKKENAYKIVEPNDFAYNPMNVRFGAVARHKGNFPVSVSGYYDIFTTRDKTDLKFMDSFLVSDMMIKYYNKFSTGSLVEKQRVHFSEFIEFNLPIPSLKEREKIAKILSVQEKIIDLQQKKIDELQKLKKLFLKKMFPQKGKKVPEWRFSQFNGAWEQRKLNEVVKVYDGTHQTPKYQDNGVMFVSVEDIKTLTSKKYISKEDYEKNYSVVPETGDILMTRIGDIGTVNIVRNNMPLAYYVSLALLKNKHMNPEYLKANIMASAFQNELWLRTLHTAYPKKINKDEIGKCLISIAPTKEEQTVLGNYFEKLDNLIVAQQRMLEEQKKYKEALMKLLLMGIVRVNK